MVQNVKNATTKFLRKIMGIDNSNKGGIVDQWDLVGAINVMARGAVGDGVTDDRAVIQQAIDDAYNRGGGIVHLPVSSNYYLIGSPGLTMKSRVTLRGDVREKGTIIKRNGTYNLISAIGTSILTDTSGNGQTTKWRLQDLRIDGADQQYPLVDVRAANLLEFHGVCFWASLQQHLLFYEVFDSRFWNCRFGFGGDSAGNYYSCDFLSGSDGTTTWELTNQLHFYSCVWESNRGKIIRCENPNGGGPTNEIFFSNCKGENVDSNCSDQYYFKGCNNIIFGNFQITTRGTAGNLINQIIQFKNTNTIYGQISWEHVGTVAINANVDASRSSASPTAASITNIMLVDNALSAELMLLVVTPWLDALQGTEAVVLANNTAGVNIRVNTFSNLKKKSFITPGVQGMEIARIHLQGWTTSMALRFRSFLSTLTATGIWEFGRISDDGAGNPRFNVIHNNGSNEYTVMSLAQERDVIFSGGIKISSTNSLTANGTTQGTATALTYTSSFYNVTTVAAGVNDGVILPAGGTGKFAVVRNSHATDTLKIYPQTGGSINGGSTNAAYSLAAGKTTMLWTTSSNVWVGMLGA